MLITLTTDFGVSSPYVAAMKGALLRVCSDVTLIDISHGIVPQDVRQAAVVLADVTPQFPPGTLHVAVIDPGVGTERKLIYVELGDHRYLAPDNGVLSYLAARRPVHKIITLTDRKYWQPETSHTFHGRDILAPVAGHLAAGVAPEMLGPKQQGMIELSWNQPQFTAAEIRGEVLTIDSFGNVITNIATAELTAWAQEKSAVVSLGGRSIAGIQTTYGTRPTGELIALTDSQGRLEIAVVNGNAGATLQAQAADAVSVRLDRPSL